MTLEEAENLKPGDIIFGDYSTEKDRHSKYGERTLVKSEVRGNDLYWKDIATGAGNSWDYKNLVIVKKAKKSKEEFIKNIFVI